MLFFPVYFGIFSEIRQQVSNAYGHTRHRASIVPPTVFAKEVGEQYQCVFYMSMRPVLRLPKHTPKSKKYRAERPPFF